MSRPSRVAFASASPSSFATPGWGPVVIVRRRPAKVAHKAEHETLALPLAAHDCVEGADKSRPDVSVGELVFSNVTCDRPQEEEDAGVESDIWDSLSEGPDRGAGCHEVTVYDFPEFLSPVLEAGIGVSPVAEKVAHVLGERIGEEGLTSDVVHFDPSVDEEHLQSEDHAWICVRRVVNEVGVHRGPVLVGAVDEAQREAVDDVHRQCFALGADRELA